MQLRPAPVSRRLLLPDNLSHRERELDPSTSMDLNKSSTLCANCSPHLSAPLSRPRCRAPSPATVRSACRRKRS
eukprot:764813-Hanusia_phi.AAC.2